MGLETNREPVGTAPACPLLRTIDFQDHSVPVGISSVLVLYHKFFATVFTLGLQLSLTQLDLTLSSSSALRSAYWDTTFKLVRTTTAKSLSGKTKNS